MVKQNNFKDTAIGRIPKEWEVVRLENLIKEIRNGFASGKRDDNGIIQIRMNNVTPDGRLIFNSFLKVPIPKNIKDFLLKENDFLFNNTNSIDLVGKSAIFKKVKFPCTYSNHFTRIRFAKDVLPEWVLFHFIKLWRKGFFKSVAIRHVGQSAVQTKFLTKIQLPLPPLPEQKKIAEILSTADEAIQKVDEVIEKTERLKKGLMQELLTGKRRVVESKGQRVGESKGQGVRESTAQDSTDFHDSIDSGYKETEIGRIPKEWEVVKIGDISLDFLGGGTPSTSNPSYWHGDIAWMTSAHIDGRTVTTGQRYITQEGLKNSAANLVAKDNLLIATRVGIGKVAVNKVDIAISQDLTGVIIDKTRAISDFLYWNLSTQERKLKSLAQGSTIKGILREELGKLKLPLPPLPEQQKISEILSTVDKKLELLREKKGRFERVKRGLMNDLLTGKKRVKM